jgi:hypothetical protein
MGILVSRLRNKKISVICLSKLFVGLLLPSSVGAQERQGLLLNTGLTIISDSNITRTTEKTSDKMAVFSPQLQFLNNVGKHKFVFDYQGDFAAHNDNNQYNYNDQALSLAAQFDHSYRINSAFAVGYQDKIEEPGSTNAVVETSNEFNRFTHKSALAKFYYGANASTGQLVLGFDHKQRRYSNNNQGFRDIDSNTLTGSFFYRIAPKTRLLFEANAIQYDYVTATLFADPSSKEKRYLAGVEWEATAITSGTFKIGYQQKSYQDARFKDIDGLSYFLDMFWQPNSYTKIKIGAKRATDESAEQDIGGFINTGYSLGLEHALSARTQLKARYEHDKADLTFAQNRTDTRKRIGVGITHSLRTWLSISLNYRHLTRSSNDEIYAFSSNSLEMSLTTTFN